MEVHEMQDESLLKRAVMNPIGKAVDAVLRDGTIAAAWRQGIKELGEALKPFPESIQVQEVGTIFSPTQGEIAASRRPDDISPSDIAHDHNLSQPQAGLDLGQDHSRGRGR